MKILRIGALAVAAGLCIAAEPTWNPDNAAKEAEQDIRSGHIKFYWSGSIASMPVGKTRKQEFVLDFLPAFLGS